MSHDSAATPQPRGAGQKRGKLHRPTDDVNDRPSLKVKPRGSRDGDPAPAEQRAEEPTQAAEEPSGAEEPKPAEASGSPAEKGPAKPRKKVSLPPREEVEARQAYATYRPAPAGKAGERKQLATVNRGAGEREISAGFVLGVALILVATIAGVLIMRLRARVGRLETRVQELEQQLGPGTE